MARLAEGRAVGISGNAHDADCIADHVGGTLLFLGPVGIQIGSTKMYVATLATRRAATNTITMTATG